MGPLREFLIVRVGTLTALHNLRDAYSEDPTGQGLVDTALSRRDMINQIHAKVRAELPADGLAALETPGAGIDPAQHPFLAWLVSPQGLAFIMQIASIIISLFGLPPLPPLPPLPVPPKPTP